MKFDIHDLKSFVLPITLIIVIVIVAQFVQQSRDWILPILFLLLPFTDTSWVLPRILYKKRFQINGVILVAAIAMLLFQNPQFLGLFSVMVLVAALPEEWFFRAYLQKRLRNNMAAVLFVSLMFALMHFITQSSVVGLLVFFPSVLFGWVYKKTGDLVLVVLLHVLSNLVYYIYFKSYISGLIG